MWGVMCNKGGALGRISSVDEPWTMTSMPSCRVRLR